MEERRNSQRGRTFLGAQIVFNNRCSSVDCLVRNLSGDGAKLAFADGAAIPAEFEITIQRTAETRRARSVWRNETEAGILFLGSAAGKFVSLEAARRIKKLEVERDALTRRVVQLSEPA
jgi:hypothetical protein